jgi:hypothetical protein
MKLRPFCVVLYDFETSKKKATVVSSDWILPSSNGITFGARKYIFYHENHQEKPSSIEMLTAMIEKTAKKPPKNGYVYGGIFFGTFGKEKIHEFPSTCLIAYPSQIQKKSLGDMPRTSVTNHSNSKTNARSHYLR